MRLSAVHLHRVSVAVVGLLICTGVAGACSSSSDSLPGGMLITRDAGATWRRVPLP